MKRIIYILCFIIYVKNGCAQRYQLNYFIENALQNSPFLHDILQQKDLTKWDSMLIYANLKPQITATSFNSVSPVIKGWGYDPVITNERTFTSLIAVNKAIPNKKNLASQLNSINLNNQSFNNAFQLSEQDLKKTITAQYIAAFSSLKQIKFYKEIKLLLDKQEFILKELTQSNVYRQVDYLTFLVTKQQQEFLIKQQTIQYNNDLSSLFSLCGIIMDGNEAELEYPDIQKLDIPIFNHSIFYQQFELDSLKLENSIQLIENNYRPKINLFADAGYNSSISLRAYKNLGTSIGIAASVPIYDGKQKQIQISRINITRQIQSSYKYFFTNQRIQQLSQLKKQLNDTEILMDDINKQLTYAQKLIETNEKLLEVGEVKMTDYIMALSSYINTKSLITQNEITRLQIINQLNYWSK